MTKSTVLPYSVVLIESSLTNKWEAATSTGNHFAVLDGIRGLAILMVVILHAFYTNPEAGRFFAIIGWLISSFGLAVPIFFVLSGFLISYPILKLKENNRQVWKNEAYGLRRAAKIIPPYFLSLAIFSIYYFLRSNNWECFKLAAFWAVGLPNFVRIEDIFQVPYWSLVVEVHFYIVLPILLYLLKGVSTQTSTVILFCCFLIIPFVVRQLTWPDDFQTLQNIQFLMLRFPCQLDYFGWGILFSGVYVSLEKVRESLTFLNVFGYAGLILLSVTLCSYALFAKYFGILSHPTRWSIEVFHLMPGLATFFMLFFVFDRESCASRILSFAPLRFVGLVSYEWYLFHLPVLFFFQESVGQTHGSLLMYATKTILPLALTFGFSVVIYHFFSLPLLKRSRVVNLAR